LAGLLLLGATWACARLTTWTRQRGAGQGPPPGYQAIWRCRATGFETNLPPEDVARCITEGRVRSDPEKPWITLLPCPDCGKLELEPQTVTPEGRVTL
jgi:hypothetical protein